MDAEAEGVIGAAEAAKCLPRGCAGSVNSEAVVIADPASETFDPRLTKFGREPDGIEGVRE
jgi:hypothetical protein